jgi:hypothetical protein
MTGNVRRAAALRQQTIAISDKKLTNSETDPTIFLMVEPSLALADLKARRRNGGFGVSRNLGRDRGGKRKFFYLNRA